ncbi:SpoIIE family protein phosphatase [Actinoplanes sp. TBRC 11911]|uniref:SpoIIE family protein phosphatase n=1 Tax=Actinoplanes sp. TBRC 11911 TaxID=2729386 RepID=UPI00145D88AC|nr:SpoIIE family protein phosphatase [Actinoplanes sp. TBRC 11911]NMO56587.1 SpoIIE family protein phosphatase [Actinoplanes sp. TBRC 11911]
MGQAYAEAVSRLRAAPDEPDRVTVERAAGLLAGRAHCRIADAHRHLMRMAVEQRRDLVEVAAAVIRRLDTQDEPVISNLSDIVPPPPQVRRFEPWIAMVQRVLDISPGMAAFMTPERDEKGHLADLVWAAVSPAATVANGLRGVQLIGRRLSEYFPDVIASDRWEAYQNVLDSGNPAALGPFPHLDGLYSVRAHRLGQGLLLNWTRHVAADGESDRVSSTERLANLGWGDWDLVSGEIYWSDQLYRIYERDPRLGPMSREESDALAVAEDAPLREAATAAFRRNERVDVTTRVRIAGRVKHLRSVVDAIRDAEGQPLRIFGIVQDVTEQEDGARRLAEVERLLADEHELAGRLQRIILPIPKGPIELPGLKVAVRYLPAGQEGLVGGDWYHAAELRDGSVLLAVGDVAGHGTPAATTMAQLRHALRALAVTTTDPARLLRDLNRLTWDLQRDNPELSATAVVARYDPLCRRIVWAQAGHPPPLLSRGGRTTPLARPKGPMLGVLDDAEYQTASLDFRIGDLFMLYTDGLVEHRRRGVDDGLASVITAMDEAVAASPQQPLGRLLSRLRQANPDDDTCILAVRAVTGETRDLRHYVS